MSVFFVFPDPVYMWLPISVSWCFLLLFLVPWGPSPCLLKCTGPGGKLNKSGGVGGGGVVFLMVSQPAVLMPGVVKAGRFLLDKFFSPPFFL